MGVAVVVIANDFSAINVALPTMEQDFDTNVNTIQWVINAYALTFGVMIVTGGRLADMFGRRNAFFLGTAIFASMSALGGAAQTRDLADRDAGSLMGIGGALMWPAILGMTYELLPEEKAGLAGGIIIGAAGLGNAIGPLIGGVLTDALSWRWIFFLNVPISIFAVARHLLPGPGQGARGRASSRIDYAGIAALSVGLVSLLVALDQVDDWGWGDPKIDRPAGPRGGCCRRLRADRAAGRRCSALVPREVMRNESFRASCLAILFMSATFFAALLYLPQFMQKQLDYSPLEAGRRDAALPRAPSPLVSFVAGPLYNRLGAKPLAAVGAACITIAPFLFSLVDADSGYGSLVVGMVVLGIGIGSFYPTATTAGVTSVDESQTSLAGGIVYMFQIAGGSIGLGLTTTVFSAAGPTVRRRDPGRLPARRRALAGRLPDRALLRRRQAGAAAAQRPEADASCLVTCPARARREDVDARRRRAARRRPGRRRARRCRRRRAGRRRRRGRPAGRRPRRRAACRAPSRRPGVSRAGPPRIVTGIVHGLGRPLTWSSPPSALTSKPATCGAWQISSFGFPGGFAQTVAADFERDDRVDHVVAAVAA